MLSIWQRFLFLIGLHPDFGPRTYEIREDFRTLHEGHPENESILDPLDASHAQYQDPEALWLIWESLTLREKEVAALTCLGYTNRQIATLMVVSLVTVKFHNRNVLRKFGVKNKAELRSLLALWDFSTWNSLS